MELRMPDRRPYWPDWSLPDVLRLLEISRTKFVMKCQPSKYLDILARSEANRTRDPPAASPCHFVVQSQVNHILRRCCLLLAQGKTLEWEVGYGHRHVDSPFP